MKILQTVLHRIPFILIALTAGFFLLARPEPSAAVQCPAITLGPNLIQNGTVGKSYSLSFTASGGRAPYSFSKISGAMPPGTILNSAGSLSGTPTEAGSFTFRLRAVDADGCPGEKSYTISVICPTITINPSSLPAATIDVRYSQSLTASGGTAPYTFSIASGSMPPGIFLGSNGAFGGAPNSLGSYSFTIRATDDYGCTGTRAYTVIVGCPDLLFTPATLPGGTKGEPYSQIISVSGGQAPYLYNVSSGTLPPGLSLSTAGLLSGTPTTPGSYTVSVSARDANFCASVRTYRISIACPTITINPPGILTARVGMPYSWGFNAIGGTGPYSFALTAGSLPDGLSITGTSITGTATTAGSHPITLRATDANGCVGERQYTLTVSCPTITISPTSLPGGTVGTAYSQTITATGGNAPYAFSLSSGTLPAGLMLSAGGTISGTPTASGTSTFNLQVTDAFGCIQQRTMAIVISNIACPTITVNPTVLSKGGLGAPYNQTITATGGTAPYSFALSNGSLPSGLTLAATGELTGTPTATGTATFTVRATDANGCTGQRIYNLAVQGVCPTLTITPASLPAGTVGTAYSQTFTATGGTGPYVFNGSGTIPPGLTPTQSGTLSGVPTAAGTYNFKVSVQDANGCPGERDYTLVINNPTCPTITINPTTLPGGTTGAVYSQTLTAAGGVAPYVFGVSSGSLPTGLALAMSGTLSGTPTAPGTYGFTVRTREANGCTGEREYTIVIAAPACPTISLNPTNAALPAGTTGTSYTQFFTATGSTTSYSFTIVGGAFPGGLSLNSNGTLTGTPSAAGTFNFTVRATDGNGCAGERAYSLVINPPACPTITIAPTTLTNGTVGSAYNQVISASGGAAPYSFSLIAGTLPAGLALNSTTGAITGSPGSAGLANFTVRATDANGCMGERAFSIVIAANLFTSVSAASFAPNTTLAPESIIAGFGVNLSPGTQVSTTLPLPTLLSGVSLKVRDAAGTERLAPLFFVSPMQVNYLMPAGTVDGPSILSVLNGGNATAEGGAEITRVSPGLFSADGTGRGLASAVAIRIRAGGAQSFESTVRFDATLNQFVAVPIDVSNPTDQVFLALYGTGMKYRSALTAVNCTIGGVVSEVLYAGEVPGFVGYDQLNVRLSPTLIGRGEVDVVVTIDGKVANTLRVSIR